MVYSSYLHSWAYKKENISRWLGMYSLRHCRNRIKDKKSPDFHLNEVGIRSFFRGWWLYHQMSVEEKFMDLAIIFWKSSGISLEKTARSWCPGSWQVISKLWSAARSNPRKPHVRKWSLPTAGGTDWPCGHEFGGYDRSEALSGQGKKVFLHR